LLLGISRDGDLDTGKVGYMAERLQQLSVIASKEANDSRGTSMFGKCGDPKIRWKRGQLLGKRIGTVDAFSRMHF
jgi:hypothetical protein